MDIFAAAETANHKLLAGIGVGLYKDEQDAFDRVARPGRVYERNLALTAKYAERFRIFEQIYPALREVNAGIHRLA